MARNQSNSRRTSAARATQSSRAWNQSNQRGSGYGLTTGLLSLAGGLGAGAALMYLFDPEAGEQRRQRAAECAKNAMESGGAALGSAVHSGGETLGSAWETISEKAHGAVDSLRESLPHLPHLHGRKMLREARDSASDTAGSWLDSARGYVPTVSFGRRQSGVSGTTASAAAVSALALGVSAMWLFDPARGRGRRAWIGQKLNRCLNETGRFMNATGRHLRNRMRGYAHEAGSVLNSAGGYIGDSTIAERVRAALGHLGLPGSSIGVRCLDGKISLTGRCAADDVDRVLYVTRRVVGVVGIDNNMEVGDTFGAGATPNASNLSA